MDHEQVRAIAAAIRKENRAEDNGYWQSELKKKFGNVQLRQPKAQTLVFSIVACLGKLNMLNNSAGYPYQSYMWVGYTVETNGRKVPKPKLMLLEIQLNKLEESYTNEYLVGLNGDVFIQADEDSFIEQLDELPSGQ